MRKTKIVCTLGPATDDPEVLKKIMKAGMDVARLNFSHGTYEDHDKRISMFKEVRDSLGYNVALLLDTKGPEIRIGCFKENSIQVKEGEFFTLVTEEGEEMQGDLQHVYINYKNLPHEVHIGTAILLDDGLIGMEVISKTDTQIKCVVTNGGKISNRKSINIPSVNVKMPYISPQDIEDIKFGIAHDVDFIAASFVRTAFDVTAVRKVLEQNNGGEIQIIAKIENREGVKNIDSIIKAADGIMVARGDMGVEIPLEELPEIQKSLIKKVYFAGKKVITATQMLESMMVNPRPTRAEVTDIANAIYDGTSAIMLSGETAVGKYPVESVETMARIACTTESKINYKENFRLYERCVSSVTNAISHATCMTAHELGATAIITVSKSGETARMISKYRPDCPIIAAVLNEHVRRQLALSWGIHAVLSETKESTEELFEHAVGTALQTKLIKNGDLVVITGGMPLGISGTTNTIKVHMVGHVLVTGESFGEYSGYGKVCVAKSPEEAHLNFEDGDILVIRQTSNALLPILKKASGIIVEEKGASSHAAIVGMSLEIPVVTNAREATNILKSGTTVTIDGSRGIVYSGITKVL